MDVKIINFLEKEHVSVLATVLSDGQPHTAAMHYAISSKPLKFVFFTKPKSRKSSHFELNKEYLASVVVGFDETKMIEFQSEGVIKMANPSEIEFGVETFISKFKGAELDSDHIVLIYTPKWWRYTEFKPEYKVIESN